MESKLKERPSTPSETIRETDEEKSIQQLYKEKTLPALRSEAEKIIETEESQTVLVQHTKDDLRDKIIPQYRALLNSLVPPTDPKKSNPETETLGILREKLWVVYSKKQVELFLLDKDHPKWLPHASSYLGNFKPNGAIVPIKDKKSTHLETLQAKLKPLQNQICQIALEKMPRSIQELRTQLHASRHKLFEPRDTFDETVSFDLTKTVVGHNIRNFYSILDYANKNEIPIETDLQKTCDELDKLVNSKFKDWISPKSTSSPTLLRDPSLSVVSGFSPHSLSDSSGFLSSTPRDSSACSTISHPPDSPIRRKLNFDSVPPGSPATQEAKQPTEKTDGVDEGTSLGVSPSGHSYQILPTEQRPTPEATNLPHPKPRNYCRYIKHVAGSIGVLACLTSLFGYGLKWGLNDTTLTQSTGFDLLMSRSGFTHRVTVSEIVTVLAVAIAIVAAYYDKKSQEESSTTASRSRFCC